MMGFTHPGEVLAFALALGLPIMIIFGRPLFRHWIAMRELRFERETQSAGERATLSTNSTLALERRLRVIEEIVTDRPNRLAREIDQLHVGSKQ